MSNMINSIFNMRLLDNLAYKQSAIHKIHPLAKLITTLTYLVVIASFGKYQLVELLPFVFYPVLIFSVAEIPVTPILKRVLVVEPVIIGIGILNVFFDPYIVVFQGIAFSRGWITFLSIFIKCGLTVVVSLLLVATSGMERVALALRMLKVPKIFVLQLLLTYRYISVLMEEAFRMQRAYSMRAPKHKGVQINVWGSFAGQLILRTLERAQRVYQSMSMRGFSGEYNTGRDSKICLNDIIYVVGWSLFFIIARMYNIPMLLGALFS